ncbi:putative acetyltransferase [Fontibacillus phaseoli]|uniref:Putative acetyltransferase n=1 Tax=Fontibacillus phaseoli TaxID=1416533 RepID=A0A369BTI4_9BACL|nr:putative acetyltransferase [Fontibacillus phaseoli]
MILAYITAFEEKDYDKLVRIWYEAVRRTHYFLKEEDFEFFHQFVKGGALRTSELWVEMNAGDEVIGFMGLEGSKIATLFVDPDHFGKGVGRRFIRHAEILKGSHLQVDVNEQNEGALQFYLRCGFVPIGRSERDDSGKLYPLVHLEMNPSCG